jgi:hypothetical protein
MSGLCFLLLRPSTAILSSKVYWRSVASHNSPSFQPMYANSLGSTSWPLSLPKCHSASCASSILHRYARQHRSHDGGDNWQTMTSFGTECVNNILTENARNVGGGCHCWKGRDLGHQNDKFSYAQQAAASMSGRQKLHLTQRHSRSFYRW